MPKPSYTQDIFSYFLKFCPDLASRKLLDYGCGYCSFLERANSFPQISYTGIDVDIDAIETNKIVYPSASFFRHNTYNLVYNKDGDNDFRPNLPQQYDAIVCYSVLTHTTVDDFFNTIDYLYNGLNTGGKLMVSYLDADHEITVDFFRAKRIKEYGSCDAVSTDDYVYLADNIATKSQQTTSYFLLFFKKSYLSNRLNTYDHQLIDIHAGIGGCFQSCIVINKP